MTITISELFESAFIGEGAERSLENRYEVKGDDDRFAIRDYVLANTPTTVDGLTRRSVKISPFGLSDHWKAVVRYGNGGSGYSGPTPQTNDTVRTFDTGGGRQHIERGITTAQAYAPDGLDVPLQQNFINASKDGVQGVDIVVPEFRFTVTRFVADSAFTTSYRKSLATLTGRVNNAAFEGFNADEVLLLGVTGAYRPEFEDWELTYHFAQSDNRSDITVDGITGTIEKKGWEYMWFLREEDVDGTAGAVVNRVRAVYINQVYERGDFSALGIA
jgi:hypothetical protein